MSTSRGIGSSATESVDAPSEYARRYAAEFVHMSVFSAAVIVSVCVWVSRVICVSVLVWRLNYRKWANSVGSSVVLA